MVGVARRGLGQGAAVGGALGGGAVEGLSLAQDVAIRRGYRRRWRGQGAAAGGALGGGFLLRGPLGRRREG